ncbi:hypothetical protein PC117_g23306 [Phytophthora cactorum]|uniref:Uncharacterized protein n=1 Tax=Phytophthora cactorum TaxID=29920 RepID=A0A8T1B719_9STRA|nr:hypothetical protein PC117_g23306 [Phytophthora cactorum]
MVFRFTPSQDLEMMRELIRQKPFAAKRGAMVKVKQIRDRLNLLKARLKANEQASFLASGVEESLDAVNIQSHYSDLDGKKKKEEDLAKCAADIVAESRRRRIERDGGASDSDLSNSSYAGSTVSATESAASVGSAKSTTQRTPKRSNAFLTEVKRQEKRYKEQMELKVRELEQDQKQFEERLSFEKKLAEDRLNFEDRMQASNREVILECAKIFGSALSKK